MRSFKILMVVFILKFIALNHCSEALRILGLYPVPVKSHFVLGETLMKVLAERGHQIDFVSHFPQKKPFPNYRDISLAGTIPTTENNVTFEECQTFGSVSFQNFFDKVGTRPCNLLSHPKLQDLLNKPKKSYDLIIVEMFAAHCYIAFGKHFDAPVVGVISSKMQEWIYAPFGNSLNTAYIGSLYASYTQEMTFYERLINTITVTANILKFNYYLEGQRYHVEKYFNRRIFSMQELYDDVALLLVNSHFSINEIKQSTPDIIEIGGLHVDRESDSELSEDLKKWLDESENGCVYISFGSMVRFETLTADKLEAFYEMFRRITPVRVLMKIADPKLLPPNLPKNVKTLPWLPQVAILKHKNTKAFVTHGGLLGTLESLGWGVPLVGLPLFSDQFTNMETYSRKKIATTVDIATLTADTLTNAVKTVLTDPEYRKNIENIASLFMDRPMSPKDTAIYWIEYVARHGNRLKSPATKLTWWQYYLLDVYGLILGSVIIVLYIAKKIISFIFKFFYSYKNSNTSINSKSKKLQ